VSRDILRGAAEQFQLWVKEQADKWNAPIVEPPRGRRDEFVDPYFRGAGPDQVIVILKAWGDDSRITKDGCPALEGEAICAALY
jgi:hypothetical protein